MTPDIVCVFDCFPDLLRLVLTLGIVLALAMITRQWRYVPIAAAIGTLTIIVIEAALRRIVFGELPFAFLIWPGSLEYAWLRVLTDFMSAFVTIGFFFALKRAVIWALTSNAHSGLRVVGGLTAALVIVATVLGAVLVTSPWLVPRRIAERALDLAGRSEARCDAGSAQQVTGIPDFRGIDQRRPPAPPLSAAHAALPRAYTTQMAFEHLLTRREAIRVANPERYGPHQAVALRLAIDERGNVVAATPTAGPPQFYARAVEIASQWRFVPFVREGKALAVRMERMAVQIEGPELWSASPSGFPDFSDWNSITVQLRVSSVDRAMSLDIRGDGTVTYEGSGNEVAMLGRHCGRISRQSLRALLAEIRRANFFAMRDHYGTKRDSIRIRVALDDQVQEVGTGGVHREEAPEQLWVLVDAIMESAHAERWTRGNQYTVPSLEAERWDFSRKDVANTSLLAGVVRHGDIQTVRDLLALRAPVATDLTPSSLGFATRSAVRLTALENAANQGAFQVVDLLLSSRLAWSQAALDSAYIAALEHTNLQAASQLIAKGAKLNARNAEGRTALMAAARSGLPDLVANALNAGVEVNASDNNLFTALHWAAAPDYPRAVDSLRADRRRVIELLIAAGAKVDEPGYLRWTPLHSNWMGLENVTAALIAHGANVNAVDDDGLTPLMTNNSVEAVRLLLSAGAAPRKQNKEGKDALQVARANIFAQDVAVEIEQWMATHTER